MPTSPSLRHLFVRLPVDPDAPARPEFPPLSVGVTAVLVAVGGVAGSLARAGLGVALPHTGATWAWATLTVNVVGSGILAFLLVTLVEAFPGARIPRPLIGTGVCGGFTTFSTFAVDTVQLLHGSRPGLALGYVVASLVGTGSAAVVGLAAARAITRLADPSRWQRRLEHAEFLVVEEGEP